TEVDLPQGGLLHKLISEGELIGAYLIGTDDIPLFIHIDEHLPEIEDATPVLRIVGDKGFAVVIGGVYHLHSKHRAHLTGVAPADASAPRTRGHAGTDFVPLDVRATGAQPPSLNPGGGQIYLVDGEAAPT